jgi:hypothetical protein
MHAVVYSAENTASSESFLNDEIKAQIFTAPRDIKLSRIILMLGKDNDGTNLLEYVTVQLRNVVDGEPSTTVFGSTVIPATDLSTETIDRVYLDITKQLNSGESYAIVVIGTGTANSVVYWNIAEANTDYGTAYYSDDAGVSWDAMPTYAFYYEI